MSRYTNEQIASTDPFDGNTYEALKWAIEYTQKQLAEKFAYKNKDHVHWDAARTAIAKAEGRS